MYKKGDFMNIPKRNIYVEQLSFFYLIAQLLF